MMTRKHFNRFASAIRDTKRQIMDSEAWGEHKQFALNALNIAAARIAAVLSEENPRFDKERFLKATKIREEE